MTFRRGVTLVESLAVVGVLAVLAAMLVPALSGARQRSKELRCLTRIRGTTQSLFVYGQDWQDSLPFGGWDEREVYAPDRHLVYRIGGLTGLAQGRWALLFEDEWSGRQWNRGLQCSEQPDYDPLVPGGTDTSIRDGFIQLPMFSLSRAFWLNPKLLALDRPWYEQRVRPARHGDVLFPAEKALLFEEIAFCISGPDAEWAINRWGQTPYHDTSVSAADGSALRMPRASGLPAVFTWPFDATVSGVHGRDIPRSR